MKRIIIIGTTGSGKSTVAKKLSDKLLIPHVPLDGLFWGANWTKVPSDVFHARVKEAIQQPEWIIDGNYHKTHEESWPVADTVIWIDLPFVLTFYQCLKRSLKRAWSKEELWPGTNNFETFSTLFSKDSILVWLVKTYSENKKLYSLRLKDPAFAHIKFIRLRSRKEVKDFIK